MWQLVITTHHAFSRREIRGSQIFCGGKEPWNFGFWNVIILIGSFLGAFQLIGRQFSDDPPQPQDISLWFFKNRVHVLVVPKSSVKLVMWLSFKRSSEMSPHCLAFVIVHVSTFTFSDQNKRTVRFNELTRFQLSLGVDLNRIMAQHESEWRFRTDSYLFLLETVYRVWYGNNQLIATRRICFFCFTFTVGSSIGALPAWCHIDSALSSLWLARITSDVFWLRPGLLFVLAS